MNMHTIAKADITSRNRTYAGVNVNGWTIGFGGYLPVQKYIASGRCYREFNKDKGIGVFDRRTGQAWKLMLDGKGRFIGADGRPIVVGGDVVSLSGPKGRNRNINFWERCFALDGSFVRTRTIYTDQQNFFRKFLEAVSTGAPFDFALKTTTNPHGAVLFSRGQRYVPCPVRVVQPETGFGISSDAYLVPLRIFDSIRMATFPALDRNTAGTFTGDFPYDAERGLFGADIYRRTGSGSIYYIALKECKGILEAEIFDHLIRDGRGTREEGEVLRVELKGSEFHVLRHLKHAGDRVTLIGHGEKLNGKTVLTLGTPAREMRDGIGLRTFATFSSDTIIRRSKTTGEERPEHRYRLLMGRDRGIWVGEDTVKEFGLKRGEKYEVVKREGKPVALKLADGRTIPFTLVWKWDGRRFRLIYTTLNKVSSDMLKGYCVVERKRTTSSHDCDVIIFKNHSFQICPRAPWETPPLTVSVLIIDGKDLLYFSDRGRFTHEDWKIARACVHKAGKTSKANIKSAERKKHEAEKATEQSNLEAAYDLLIAAFLLNPSERTYLREAIGMRRQIILRKKREAKQQAEIRLQQKPKRQKAKPSKTPEAAFLSKSHNLLKRAGAIDGNARRLHRLIASIVDLRRVGFAYRTNTAVWKAILLLSAEKARLERLEKINRRTTADALVTDEEEEHEGVITAADIESDLPLDTVDLAVAGEITPGIFYAED